MSLPRTSFRPVSSPVSLPSATPLGPSDDARFVLRCVTSSAKRRRYGLGRPPHPETVRQAIVKFCQNPV